MAELFTARADIARPLLYLRNGKKRFAFAMVNAINTTAKEFQRAIQYQVGRVFVLRSQFITRQAAIIKPFANVRENRLWARISVGQKRRLLLSTFETGGPRLPFKGKNVAVPVTGGPARPVRQASVQESYTFKALALARSANTGRRRSPTVADVKVRRTKTVGGKTQWKGQMRTFMLLSTARHPEGGVFQRIGPKKDDIRIIYSFRSHLRVPAILSFRDTARRMAPRLLRSNLQSEVIRTLRYQAGLR